MKELSEATLLFLSHIKLIAWNLSEKDKGEIIRSHHAHHHIEILRRANSKSISSLHYLRFTCPVKGLESQNVAIAFELELLPKIKYFNTDKPLSNQFRIIPANLGRVCRFSCRKGNFWTTVSIYTLLLCPN